MGESSGSRLWDVTWRLLASLAFELLCAMVLQSYMLWENVVSGVVDIAFVLVNVWGLYQEDPENPLAGWWVAFWSDAAFAGVFALYTLAAVTHMYRKPDMNPVSGVGVLCVAVIAMSMNYICSHRCPQETKNGRSAQMKLRMGVVAGGAAAADGVITWFTRNPFVDILCTILVGTGIVLYICRDLRRRWQDRTTVDPKVEQLELLVKM